MSSEDGTDSYGAYDEKGESNLSSTRGDSSYSAAVSASNQAKEPVPIDTKVDVSKPHRIVRKGTIIHEQEAKK